MQTVKVPVQVEWTYSAVMAASERVTSVCRFTREHLGEDPPELGLTSLFRAHFMAEVKEHCRIANENPNVTVIPDCKTESAGALLESLFGYDFTIGIEFTNGVLVQRQFIYLQAKVIKLDPQGNWWAKIYQQNGDVTQLDVLLSASQFQGEFPSRTGYIFYHETGVFFVPVEKINELDGDAIEFAKGFPETPTTVSKERFIAHFVVANPGEFSITQLFS